MLIFVCLFVCFACMGGGPWRNAFNSRKSVSHSCCCFENNPCNLCQADLASAPTTSPHLLPNRHCSAEKGLWGHMFANRTNARRERSSSWAQATRTRIVELELEEPNGLLRERRARREPAPHTHHLRNWAQEARKRPRLRPSYITWNPFVLLQCICTPHSSPPTTLIPANVTWKVWHRDTMRVRSESVRRTGSCVTHSCGESSTEEMLVVVRSRRGSWRHLVVTSAATTPGEPNSDRTSISSQRLALVVNYLH